MKIRFHRHTCLYNRHGNAISPEYYARGSTCTVLHPHAAGEPPARNNQPAVRARPRSIQFLDKPPLALWPVLCFLAAAVRCRNFYDEVDSRVQERRKT